MKTQTSARAKIVPIAALFFAVGLAAGCAARTAAEETTAKKIKEF